MTLRQNLQGQVRPLRMAQERSDRLFYRALVFFAAGDIVALLWQPGGAGLMMAAVFIAFWAFHLRLLGSIAKRNTILCPVCSKPLGYLFIDRDYIHRSALIRIPEDVPEKIAACPYCRTGMDEPLGEDQLSGQSHSPIREAPASVASALGGNPVSRAIIALRVVGTILLVGMVVTVTHTPAGMEFGGGILLAAPAKFSVAVRPDEVYLTSSLLGFVVSLLATWLSIRTVGSTGPFRWSLLFAFVGIASLLNEATRLGHDHIQVLFCFPLLQVIADWRSVRFLKMTEAQRTAQRTGCLSQGTTEAQGKA